MYAGRKAGIGKTCLVLNWSAVDMFFIRLFKMTVKEVHRHRITYSEPPDWRKTLVPPTG